MPNDALRKRIIAHAGFPNDLQPNHTDLVFLN